MGKEEVDEEEVEKQGIYTSVKSIIKTAREIKIVSVETFSRLAKDLERVGTLLENVTSKLTEMIEDKDEKNNDLRDIVVSAGKLNKRAQALFTKLSQGNATLSDKLTAVDYLLQEVPSFIQSIEYLNLGEVSKELPSSAAELKEKALAAFRGMIEDVFPAFITEQVKKLKSSALGTDAEDIDVFNKMDHAEKVVTLAALHKMNVLMRKLVLRTDEIEIRYTLKQHSIFNMIRFGVDFSDNNSLSHLSIPEKSVNEWFEVISNAYAARLKAFGHVNAEEVYPYTQAVLQARKANLREMSEAQEKVKGESAQEFEAKRWSKAESDVNLAITEAKAANEVIKFSSIKADRLARIKFLGELAVVLKQKQGADMKFMNDFRKTKGIQPHASLTTCFQAIEKAFVRIDDVRTHTIEKKDKEINRLATKIVRLEMESSVGSPPYVNFADDDDALVTSVQKLVTNALRDLASFMQAAQMHVPAKEVKAAADESKELQTTIDGVIEHLIDMKATLQKVLDVSTFDRVFAQDYTAATAEVSWVDNVGRGYQALHNAVETLRKIQDRYQHASEKSKEVSPQASLKEFVDLASEFSEASAKLAWSMEGLVNNPAVRSAGEQAGNWRVTFEHYKRMVESDPWYIFALGEGQDSAKRLLGAERVQELIKDVSRFYAYAGAKFGHDDETREKVVNGLADIRHLTIASNKLKYDAKTSSVIGFVFSERHKILSVLPSIGQINQSLKDIGVEQGLEMLDRVNKMLKKLYLFADEIETTFHLRKGYITEQLLSFGEGADKKSLHSYLVEFQQVLNENEYEFAPDDAIPYEHAIQRNREDQSKSLRKQEEVLKDAEAGLLKQKADLEAAMSEGVDEKLTRIKDHQSSIDGAIDQLLGQLRVTNTKIVTFKTKYEDLSKKDDDNDVDQKLAGVHEKLIDLVQLQTTAILARLDRELIFLKARLKDADSIDKQKLQERIDNIKLAGDNARVEIGRLPASVRHGAKYKSKNLNSGNHAADAEAKVRELNDVINAHIVKLKQFKLEHKVKADMVEMAKLSSGHKARLQEIKVLQEEQATKGSDVDNHKAIEKLQADEHRYIALQAIACAKSSEYKKVVADLYANSVSQLNLATASALLTTRIANELIRPVEDNSLRLAEAKRMAVNYLDAEIEKLRRDKFSSPLLFRKSKLGVKLKKLDVLTYLRDQYMRPGFKFEDAQSKLKAKSDKLYKFGLSHYRSLYDKVKVLDNAPGLDHGRRIVGEDPVKKISGMRAQDDLVAMVESRKAELTKELSNRVVFISTKKKKIVLLEELNKMMNSMSYAAAMESVRASHADTFDLLLEGRTGKLMKSIEIGSYAKSDIQKMITVEIDRLKLAKDKSYTFFATSRREKLQSRIDALQKLMNEGFDVSKLDKNEINILKKHEKSLLKDCSMFVEYQVRRAAPPVR